MDNVLSHIYHIYFPSLKKKKWFFLLLNVTKRKYSRSYSWLIFHAGGSLEMFMTDDQKKYYAAMKKMGNKKPVKATPRPRVIKEFWLHFKKILISRMKKFQWKPQAIVFGIVTNKKFDMIIMIFIGLNMLTMTLDHYHQSPMWSFALDNLNMGFIVIFSSECILKIFALRQYYFKEPWNIFDFVVVILSILGTIYFPFNKSSSKLKL